MGKELKNTNSNIIVKGDYFEAIIVNFNKKLQISAEFIGWDTMSQNSSVRFFNINQSAPLAKGEAWLFKITAVDVTNQHLRRDGRKIIVFTVKPIKKIIDRESTYFDSKSKQWVETFSCGNIPRYKKIKISAKCQAKTYKCNGMLHKLDIITDAKTGKIIQVLHFTEFTPGEFLKESQKKLGRGGITKVSMENISEAPVELLGKIKHSPFTRQI